MAGQQGFRRRQPLAEPLRCGDRAVYRRSDRRGARRRVDQVLLENVQFPSSTSTKQDYGATNGVDRAGQLTADIAAWQARFGDTVTLWYDYSLAEVTGSSSQLGAPAAQLGVKNLLVKVPSSSTLDAAAREEMTLSLTEAGVEHVVIRDDAASYFE